MQEHKHSDDTMRWVRRGSALAALLVGWVFILVTNNFRITPPVVFVCLGYLAGVAAIYTLYRTGATAVTHTNEEDDALSWEKPLGALDELEREKRALLKAIKEAEFDHQMGKLSKADADAMIAIYRGRAIEVIKEIDVQNSTSGKAGSVRDRILREARARIHVAEKSKADEAPAQPKKDKGGDKQKARADKLADAVNAAKETKADDKAADKADADKPAAKADDTADDKADADKVAATDKVADKATDTSDGDDKVADKATDTSDGADQVADQVAAQPTPKADDASDLSVEANADQADATESKEAAR